MRFKKIQTKVFCAMLITSLIPVGIISAILFFMITQTVHTEVSVSTNRTAVDIQEKVEEYFLNLDNGVYNIYYNTKLLKALQNGSRIQADNTDDYEVSQDIRRFFTSLYNFSKINDILGIYLFNQKGDMVDYFTPSSAFLTRSQYAGMYPEDIRIGSGQPTVSIVYNKWFKEDILHYAEPLMFHGDTPIGLVGIDMKLQPFRNLVEKYNLFPGSKIIILDREDKIVYHTDMQKIGTKYTDRVGPDQRLIRKPLDFLNWNLVYIYQINPQTLLFRNIALTVMAISIILMLSLSAMLSHSITRPIKTLVRVIKQMEIGDFNKRVEVSGQDEISLLGAHFNRMAARTKQLIDDEYKSQINRKEAELKALQVQINPHFLYNTLQTIGSIASLRNVPEIKVMCRSLSNMFRYSIKMKDEWVPVKEELTHVRNYLIIINKRYGDILRTRLVVDESANRCLMPKLIFQPIVENCIEHGLIPSGRPNKLLKLKVLADRDNGLLSVLIIDNGVGMTSAKVEKLNGDLAASFSHSILRKDDSIGLLNVQTRIRMLCGPEYGLSVASKVESGTVLSIRLPLKGEEHV
ncbi:MAG TPA: histidine kinase [Paenibacillus sp.]|uniref:cache domain-containing sensor histidine kinase n=1 Tax=Paenibacillus sp. TaxID=58172 RepID=UPI002B6F2247|nr:histidine kinase [Paenibacillus sp.]HUC91910.1 histidine kinase [Paenibacillus sp.]